MGKRLARTVLVFSGLVMSTVVVLNRPKHISSLDYVNKDWFPPRQVLWYDL